MRSSLERRAELNQQTRIPHLSEVRDFWDVEACGTHLVHADRGTVEFYKEFRDIRYKTEWHLPLFVPFNETRGKKVLEIGCGNGADGVMFALAGAEYTGVDLTDAAVIATRRHFETLDLEGRFQIENAEQLSFSSESFDYVYSHGVLHHTARPEKAFSEVFRVLKPGGKAILMLYHRHSFNYYVRILGYMRVRVLLYSILRLTRHSSDRAKLRKPRLEIRGNQSSDTWRAHYENVLRYGWRYLKARTFVHHATDGPECPIAHVYTKKMIHHLFRQFRVVQTRVAHLPLRKYLLFKWVPPFIERRLSSLMGWYLFVYLEK